MVLVSRRGASWAARAGFMYHHQRRICTVLSLPSHIWADIQWRKREEDLGQVRDAVGQALRALLAACIQFIWGQSVTNRTHRMEGG